MQLTYLTQLAGPLPYRSKIGVSGIGRALTNEGVYENPLAFECVVDNVQERTDRWGVYLFLHPIDPVTSAPFGIHTCLCLGRAEDTPYLEFEEALAACKAISMNMYNRDVKQGWVQDLANTRQLGGRQWSDDLPNMMIVQEGSPNPNNEQPDGEGDTCDVKPPAGHVLH